MITLRAAEPEDSDQIAEILIASRKAFIPYAPIAHSEVDVHEWVKSALVPSGQVTIASNGGQVIGVLAVGSDQGASWINQLYVAPESVGQGVGTQLLRRALASLPRPVRLYTFQANVRSRSFYERHGFVAVAFTDGSGNEESCPDVLYELASTSATPGA